MTSFQFLTLNYGYWRLSLGITVLPTDLYSLQTPPKFPYLYKTQTSPHQEVKTYQEQSWLANDSCPSPATIPIKRRPLLLCPCSRPSATNLIHTTTAASASSKPHAISQRSARKCEHCVASLGGIYRNAHLLIGYSLCNGTCFLPPLFNEDSKLS